ncbi:ATP-binding protein [Actinocorallia sp. API 0066]|uniref:helicase HerA domain-containing protein n=1 Tax=Actinocorallia sp. API 0066 TaxID=2896846 RepID=UPI001E35CA91|nr:DUF87 domain-containing protein [Actinocorallia sp. API 0066]MCD0450411.1 ATP-binding protein [Actinocorallia sp. API 0066]
MSFLIPGPVDVLAFASANGPLITAASASWLTAVLGGRFVLSRWRAVRFAEGARLVEISVPPHVETDSAAAWWSHLIGLTSPWWKRASLGQPPIGWEHVADSSGVRIQVRVPGTVPPGLVEKTIRWAWPGASVTTSPVEPLVRTSIASRSGGMRLAREDHFPLRADFRSDPLRALLGTVAGLRPGEQITVQVLARPVTGRRLRKANRAAAALRTSLTQTLRGHLFNLFTPRPTNTSPGDLARQFPERADEVRAILAKAASPRYEVQIGFAVSIERGDEAAARGRLRGRAHEVASTFALFSSGHQYLRRMRRFRQRTRLNQRRLDRGFLLSVPELAVLAHLPYDAAVPGVSRAGARSVAPSPAVPTGGALDTRVLGDAETGHRCPVTVGVAGARQHLHVLGQTGVGKSTFLANLILADARAGRALVIDPKGDLINDVLDRAPERVMDRTVILDPGEAGPPPCLNVLADPDTAFAVDSVVTIFRRCFSSSWGPRLDDLMRSACLTLVQAHGDAATLADIPKLLTDTPYRARVVGRVRDELLSGFWSAYDDLTPSSRAAVIGPAMNKLRAVLLRPSSATPCPGGPRRSTSRASWTRAAWSWPACPKESSERTPRVCSARSYSPTPGSRSCRAPGYRKTSEETVPPTSTRPTTS